MLLTEESVGILLLRLANPLLSVWVWMKRYHTTRDMRQLRNTLTLCTSTSTTILFLVAKPLTTDISLVSGRGLGKTVPNYGVQNLKLRMTPQRYIASNSKANTTSSLVMDKRILLHSARQHSSKPGPRKPELPSRENMLREYTAACLQYQAFSPTASLSEKLPLLLDGIRARSNCSQAYARLLHELKKRLGKSMIGIKPILVWLVDFLLSVR